MLEIFYPDERIHSAYDIDYRRYYEMGYRGVIFDIDNTLVPHGLPATPEAVELFRQLREIGFDTCLLSNNKLPRVEMFNKDIGSHYICNAHKPGRENYIRASEMMGCTLCTTLFVGDQIFTDVWGAKRTGIRSILTDPIHPKEEIQIVLKRLLERIVLISYERAQRRKNKAVSRESND